MIINEYDIDRYLRKKGEGIPHLSDLLISAIKIPLMNTPQLLIQIKDENEIPTENLKRKFRKANQRKWYKFIPHDHIDELIQGTGKWLVKFLISNQDDFKGMVRIESHKKLKTFKSLTDLQSAIQNGSLLSTREIETQKKIRLISDEESKNLVQFETMLDEQCFLIRINTIRGMKNAQNCLGANRLPDGTEPHKSRVLKPEQWLYFSIRDPDNRSIATIGIDARRGTISVEGNGQKPVTGSAEHLVLEAIKHIQTAYPEAVKNYRQPYGSQPRQWRWNQSP
jgi:hypothetical protein